MTKLDNGDVSHSTASAISRGSAMRAIGEAASSSSISMFGSSSTSLTMGVRVNPGAIALTRIPLRPCSTAAVRVSPTTPCFAAVYDDNPAVPTTPATDAVLTIVPVRAAP